MPQVQVLDYRQDPGAEQTMNAMKGATDSFQRLQELKIQRAQLDIQAKAAESESAKLEFEKEKAVADWTIRGVENGYLTADGVKSGLASRWIKMGVDSFGPNRVFDFWAKTADSIPKSDRQGAPTPAGYAPNQRNIAPDVGIPLPPASKKLLAESERQIAEADKLNAETARLKAIKDNPNMIWDQFGGNPPVGTTAQYDPLKGETTYNIPLNRAVSVPEADAISKGMVSGDIKEGLLKAVKDGVLGKGIERSIRQAEVENPSALFTSADQDLQNFQSLYNALRQISLFDEAGKALTGTEKEESLRKLSLLGKSDETILNDFTYLLNKHGWKSKLLTGGMNAIRGINAGTVPQPQATTPAAPATGGSKYKLKGVRRPNG